MRICFGRIHDAGRNILPLQGEYQPTWPLVGSLAELHMDEDQESKHLPRPCKVQPTWPPAGSLAELHMDEDQESKHLPRPCMDQGS